MSPVSANKAQSVGNGYYVIRTENDRVQQIKVNILNKRSTTLKLSLSVNTGYTQDSGVYAWDSAKIPNDSSLKYKLRDYVQPKTMTVSIPPKSTKEVGFTLNAPASYSGVLMGGITSVPDGGKETGVNGNTALKIKYAYGLPIFLKMDNVRAVPNMSANSARGGLYASKTAVLANIENNKPALLANATMKLSVTRRGEKNVLHTANATGLMIAPNSNFTYPISWGGQRLEAGDYTLHGTGSTGGQSWKFTRNFTISAAEADQLNQEAGFKPDYTWLWITIAILVLIILGLLIYWLGRRSNKKKNSANEEEE
nr:DUF3324 domain-containing protein [Lacticaseibacillus saniviri]